jgi:glycosyltransferase involved in cell wall biosynthesis
MNIVQIIPGSGGSFYCGNCLRDSKMVHALRKSGHQVTIIPMYLPLFSDDKDLSQVPVFYGAVSIYLKQLYPIFRKAPGWVDKFLNSKAVLKFAAGKAGTTRANGLEDMTISMLLGEAGKQSEELDKMVDWIAENCQPDVVHLSNALLLGLAHKIKSKLNVPVICSLQDEHTWVDIMPPAFRSKVWNLMTEKSRDIDQFVSVSQFYAAFCQNKMQIEAERIKTVHLGVDTSDYTFINSIEKQKNIGFLSRMCKDNGLDILVDAFIIAKKQQDLNEVKLLISGGSTNDDKAYIKRIQSKLVKHGLNNCVEFIEDFSDEGKSDFFNRVSLLSVPVRFEEAFGIYLIESMASGIPVIQPEQGAFPEIIQDNKNGRLYKPNEPVQLANAIMELLRHDNTLEQMSLESRKSVENNFDVYIQAEKLLDIYHKSVNKHTATVS